LIKGATGEVAIDLETIKGYTGLRIRLFEKLNRVV
jgi:DNA primase